MSAARIASLADAEALVGRDLEPSAWRVLTQATVDAFADATLDHQWLHTDPVRAAAGPYGGTIAHGYLVLALGPSFMREVLELPQALNYGTNRVRFTAPLPVGARFRMRLRLTKVEPVLGGARLFMEERFEREGAERPVCVAEVISQVSFGEHEGGAGR